MAEERVVTLRIICTNLPDPNWGGYAGIRLGVQRGKEVTQEVELPVSQAEFSAELRVTEGADGGPNFLGPYAQGTVQDRFVYLCWGQRVGGAWVGFRRAKVRLNSLTWADLASGEMTVEVRGTDAKGGPVCATLPADGVKWRAGGGS